MLSPCCIDGGVDAIMASKHPIDIAIHHSGRQSESDGTDGGSCVIAHTLQLFDAFQCRGETALCYNLLGGCVQIAGTAVIAQALPFTQHLILRRFRQILHFGPSLHEAQPIVHTLQNARLLQNDFAQPDGIGVSGVSPRKVAPVQGKPVKKCGCKHGCKGSEELGVRNEK